MQAAGISKAGCSRHFPYSVKFGVSLNSREVQFGIVFRRVKVVFCIDSLLLQATGAVEVYLSAHSESRRSQRVLARGFGATLPVAAVESGSAAFT